MRGLVFIPLFLVLLIPLVSAVPAPDVRFIPSIFSTNSSFVAIADPGNVDGPVRIRWNIPECANTLPAEACTGSFPKIGGEWICYFSNMDENSTCGPSPFTFVASDYSFIATTIDNAGENASSEYDIAVGGVEIDTSITVDGNLVRIEAFPDTVVNGVSYEIYSSDFPETTNISGTLSKNVGPGYSGNVTLENTDDYYIAFSAIKEGGGDFGGSVAKISVAGGATPPNDEEEEVLVSAVKAERDILMDANHRMTLDFLGITNIGNETLHNLTTSVPAAYSTYLSIALDSDTLEPNSTTGYTITLSNIDTAMHINTGVNVSSASQKVGEIEVNIHISIRGGPPPGDTGSITISPLVWSGDFSVGTAVSKTFTITNNGDSALSSLSYAADYEIDNIANVSLPNYISAGDSASMIVELAPSSAGTYSGDLVINTGSASQTILINANFFSDISSDVNTTRDDLDTFTANLSGTEYNQLSTVISDIQGYLDDADNDLISGRYSAANTNLEIANAQLDLLKEIYTYVPNNNGGGGGEFDFTIVIIIIVVIAVGIGAWFFLKKIRSSKSLEEELEEEY